MSVNVVIGNQTLVNGCLLFFSVSILLLPPLIFFYNQPFEVNTPSEMPKKKPQSLAVEKDDSIEILKRTATAISMGLPILDKFAMGR